MKRIVHFPNYEFATNSAYKLLAERDLFSIETNIFTIAEQLEYCRLHTYKSASFMGKLSLKYLLANSEYGFSIKNAKNQNRIIYYNEQMPLSCIRFTLAHEVGHIILGHQDEDNSSAEKEANCFARNLLCPYPVADALDAKSVDDYVALFNVSKKMAEITLSFQSSDRHYINEVHSDIIRSKLYAYTAGYESFIEFEKDVYA